MRVQSGVNATQVNQNAQHKLFVEGNDLSTRQKM
jgi:hypothetical protein